MSEYENFSDIPKEKFPAPILWTGEKWVVWEGEGEPPWMQEDDQS
jgi:hypothetical protein